MRYLLALCLALSLWPGVVKAERTINDTDKNRLESYTCSLVDKTAMNKIGWFIAAGYVDAVFEYRLNTNVTIFSYPTSITLSIWIADRHFTYTAPSKCAEDLYKAATEQQLGGSLEAKALHEFLDAQEKHNDQEATK